MLTTTIAGMAHAMPPGIKCHVFSPASYPNRWIRNWHLYRNGRRSEVLLIDFDLKDICILALLFSLLGGKRCRFVTLDLFAGKPKGLMLKLTRRAIRAVDMMLVYFRDSTPFQRMLGVPAQKFRYVPFKINGIERIAAMQPNEGGYIYCGGRSRRDFRTLFEAVRGLSIPVKVVTSSEAEMRPHGSTMVGLEIPPNVEIILRDSDQQFFLECMSQATLVVLPLVKDTQTQAGIGVFIQAMALEKCVIISSGVGVSDVLTDQALIVPAGDSAALRHAISQLWEDRELRGAYQQRGAAWAKPLGGESEFYKRILGELYETS